MLEDEAVDDGESSVEHLSGAEEVEEGGVTVKAEREGVGGEVEEAEGDVGGGGGEGGEDEAVDDGIGE